MKKPLFVLFALLLALSSIAQYAREDVVDSTKKRAATAQNSSFVDRLSVGGNLSLYFGDVTYIEVAPLLGYHIIDDIAVAAGPMYQYFSLNDGGGTYTNSIYGGRVDAFIFLPGRLNNFFIQGEYEVLDVPDDYSVFSNVSRATIGVPLAGAGIRRYMGEKSYCTLSVLWDFSDSELSPYYGNPLVITAGFDFGL